MTYRIDEHTEFWGGKHAAHTLQQSVAEFKELPTPEEIRADVAAWSTAQETTADLRKQVEAWPSSQNEAGKITGLEAWNNVVTSGMVDKTKEAVKHDDGKADWSLVPFESLEGMVKVLEFGAQKYAGWNWTTNGGFSYMRVFRSCLRHLFAWARGEDLDPESGLSHIHHAMCNLLFISHYIGNKEKYNKDDRQVR